MQNKSETNEKATLETGDFMTGFQESEM